jgi:hypothetical protein
MIVNLLTIKWECWAKWIEILSIDTGTASGSLFYFGKVNDRFEFDLLFIRFIWLWLAWRGKF